MISDFSHTRRKDNYAEYVNLFVPPPGFMHHGNTPCTCGHMLLYVADVQHHSLDTIQTYGIIALTQQAVWPGGGHGRSTRQEASLRFVVSTISSHATTAYGSKGYTMPMRWLRNWA